jgi:predicted TPR repeat methyltransferase
MIATNTSASTATATTAAATNSTAASAATAVSSAAAPVSTAMAAAAMAAATESLQRARDCIGRREFAAAESLLRQAIAAQPDSGVAYELLGKLLYRESRTAEAAHVYRAWLNAAPLDPIASHLVAATSGGAPPARASDGFVAALFERAAPDFDTTLATLGYCVPQRLFETAMTVLDPGMVGFEVLDLGCGTGLCGEWFRPLARRLVGVDLSAGMLANARHRGCFDELNCAELTEYLQRCTERFDLITAADVFCYFGDLAAVFAAAARLLRPDGCFIFSVEHLEAAEDSSPIQLLEHGRYAHGTTYIHESLTQAGLLAARTTNTVLRYERGAPVAGLVIAARPVPDR